ncbi:mannose-1-phosphate guanylyltransferase [Balneolaceae bacterium ANBcel3]|nr:mannose-1-phosphate guanylyltransferase [Balneolaceae bacterium ANBcel3]
MEYALIMAGGIGARFWPKSRINKPKQFLPFFGDTSLLRNTIDRISTLIPFERILISTNADYVPLVKEQIPEVPSDNIIAEPEAKNTGPCIAFAAALIHQRDPDSTMVVLPCDHYVDRVDTFINDLKICIKNAELRPSQLVTLGVAPDRPETGYGYIQYNDSLQIPIVDSIAYPVKTFAEKPDLQTALKFLQSGDFLWNSGMFIWKSKAILDEINEHLPVLSHQVQILSMHLEQNEGRIEPEVLSSVYHSCFPISIDYGIMEKSDNVVVVPSHFEWSDVGSWMALYELQSSSSDKNGNIIDAPDTIIVDSSNCYIHSEKKRVISLVGLQGVGIIEADDALLICKLDKSQEVKKVYEKMTEKQKKKLK